MADLSEPTAPPTGGFRFPSLAQINKTLRSTDIGLAIGVMAIIVVLILPLPPMLLDVLLAISIVFSVLILMTALFIQTPLEFSLLPDRAADRRDAAAGAQPRLDPPDPRQRSQWHGRRRPRHRGLRQLRHARQFRHRRRRLRHPDHRQLHRHHQGLGPHRRSRGALQPRCHARQADGDRRRPLRRPDRRSDRPQAPRERSKPRAPSSAPWTAPASSCAATPSPAC